MDDLPGRLGQIAGALGSLGVNILEVDVQGTNGESRTDELVVDLSIPIDLPALEHAVANAGGRVEALLPADPHELRDRVVEGIEIAGALRARSDHERLAEGAKRLVGAELACVVTPRALHEPLVVERVRRTESPAQVEAPAKLARRYGGPTWWLGLPLGEPSEAPVLVLVRRGPRFSFTETARVQALLRAGGPPRSPSDGQEVALADGGTVLIRDIRAGDLPALARFHHRCSQRTLRQRYFSPIAGQLDSLLPALAAADGDRVIGLVAALGSEVVGMAHACPDRDSGDAEVAFLVEDAHHRRGIGGALYAALERQLGERGTQRVVAVTQPDNEAMKRLIQHGRSTTSAWDGGTLRVSAPIARSRPPVTPAG